MKKLALLISLLLIACGTSTPYGEIVCEPNGGPCHSAAARVLPIPPDEINVLYFSPDVYTNTQYGDLSALGERWGTLLTPDRHAVFFTTAPYDWDEQLPEECGPPGKLKFGSTTERTPATTTKDCAIYLPLTVFDIDAVRSKLAQPFACVDSKFTVIDCSGAVERGDGVFAYKPDSALAQLQPGDTISMPPRYPRYKQQ